MSLGGLGTYCLSPLTMKLTLLIQNVPSFHNDTRACAYHVQALLQTQGETAWTRGIKSLPSYLWWKKTDNE